VELRPQQPLALDAVRPRVGYPVDAPASAKGEDAAQRFEELFASVLVKEMRRSLPDGFFGDGAGKDVFEGWFDEHVGRALAERGGLGLADTVRAGLESGPHVSLDDAAQLARNLEESTLWRLKKLS
jgi:Rod binding domain-containing protein